MKAIQTQAKDELKKMAEGGGGAAVPMKEAMPARAVRKFGAKA
jgi:hypothetical protein